MNNADGKIPDLEDGFAIVYGDQNCWRTEVRSILEIKENGQKSFLTHECRAEALSSDNIFTGANYEFAPVKTPNGNFNIRSGLYNYGFGLKDPSAIYEKTDHKIETQCSDRNVIYYDMNEMIIRHKNNYVGRYFVDLEYKFKGITYRSWAPLKIAPPQVLIG